MFFAASALDWFHIFNCICSVDPKLCVPLVWYDGNRSASLTLHPALRIFKVQIPVHVSTARTLYYCKLHFFIPSAIYNAIRNK